MDRDTFARDLCRVLRRDFLTGKNFPGAEIRDLKVEEHDGDFDLVVTLLDRRRSECLLGYRWQQVWSTTLDGELELRGLAKDDSRERFINQDTVARVATIMYAVLDERLHAGSVRLPPCAGKPVLWLSQG